MKKFNIYAGLGGAEFIDTIETKDKEEAENYAYQYAIDYYESYEGCYGILNQDDVFEILFESFGEVPSEEDIKLRHIEGIDNWIIYYVEEVIDERD